jgi:hypothetical protein
VRAPLVPAAQNASALNGSNARVTAQGSSLWVCIGEREFARLIKAANVRRIKFHGLRHTVATLMLAAGVPAHVVQRRLGHSKVEMTLGIYAHALPSMQQHAAARLPALTHGKLAQNSSLYDAQGIRCLATCASRLPLQSPKQQRTIRCLRSDFFDGAWTRVR